MPKNMKGGEIMVAKVEMGAGWMNTEIWKKHQVAEKTEPLATSIVIVPDGETLDLTFAKAPFQPENWVGAAVIATSPLETSTEFMGIYDVSKAVVQIGNKTEHGQPGTKSYLCIEHLEPKT